VQDYIPKEEIIKERSGRFDLDFLCTGITHKLRNPLSGVLLNTQMLAEEIPENSPLQVLIRDILVSAQRMENTLCRLIEFAKPVKPEKVPFNPSDISREAFLLIRDQAEKASISIKTDCETDLPPAFADPNQIRNMLFQVFQNAIEAMPQGGELYYSCKKNSLSGKGDDRNVNILFCVEDTGCGISQENLEKIFSPFYTTKPQNAGLGLSMVYSLSEQNNGTVSFESTVGKGTRFSLQLPSYFPSRKQ